MVLAEEMLDINAQVIVLDPVSRWWGLRLKKDGKTPAYAIPVFGGARGDLQLPPMAGELIAQILVDRGMSAVLDLSGFNSDAEQRRFVTDFAKKLFRLKQRQDPPTPLHIFFEEAEEFLPQDQLRDQAHMVGAVKKLIKLGRNYGIGCSLVSQRSADINKKGLSQVGTLIALQTTSPHDRKAIKEWMHGIGKAGAEKIVQAALPNLAVGEAYVWSPAFNIDKRVKIRTKRTFDTSATPKLRKRAKVTLQELSSKELNKISAAITEAAEEKEKNNPALLRKRIRELEKQLKSHKPEREITEISVLTKKDRALLEKHLTATGQLHDVLRTVAGVGRLGGGEKSARGGRRVNVEPLHEAEGAHRPNNGKARSAKPLPPSRPTPSPNGVKIKKGARRMLAALYVRQSQGATKLQLGTLVGMKHTGGTFGDYLGTLRRNGFVTQKGSLFFYNESAEDYLDELPSIPDTTEAVVALWGSKLKAGARKILNLLVQCHPTAMSRPEIGDAVGNAYTGGTFNDYLGTLVRNGLVEKLDGEYRASEDLFL